MFKGGVARKSRGGDLREEAWYPNELILTRYANCVIIYTDVANQNRIFTKTEANLYVPIVDLWTQDNTKLWPQSKSGFKRTIGWNK